MFFSRYNASVLSTEVRKALHLPVSFSISNLYRRTRSSASAALNFSSIPASRVLMSSIVISSLDASSSGRKDSTSTSSSSISISICRARITILRATSSPVRSSLISFSVKPFSMAEPRASENEVSSLRRLSTYAKVPLTDPRILWTSSPVSMRSRRVVRMGRADPTLLSNCQLTKFSFWASTILLYFSRGPAATLRLGLIKSTPRDIHRS
mmetsp:Transcript_19121/g.47559  ORF Transcript_19121/g.47559 Transcript_19121/m.47559 type:complete len:210 (-) Transcript_19121:2185-2814(-)